jgi:hypothetical protein
MSLAPLLVDTYRKYKQGTGNLIQWLAKTARATGTVNGVFESVSQDAVPAVGCRIEGTETKILGVRSDGMPCQIPTSWLDMEWFIETQGCEWVLVGERPDQDVSYVRHLELAQGLPIRTLAKNYMIRKGNRSEKNIVGTYRCFKCSAKYSELSYDRDPRTKMASSRNKVDSLVTVNELVEDYFGKDGPPAKLSSLETLRLFKLAVEKDEHALAFDVRSCTFVASSSSRRSKPKHSLSHQKTTRRSVLDVAWRSTISSASFCTNWPESDSTT